MGVAFVLCLINAILGLNMNVDSIYDEGYLYQTLRRATQGEISGASQWGPIVSKILGSKVCYSILALRKARLILTCFTILVVWLIYSRTAKYSKTEKIGLFITICFVSCVTLGGIIISYNGLSQFALCVSFTLILLGLKSNIKNAIFFYLLAGCLLSIAFFSILPSAILCGFLYMSMISILENRKKSIIPSIASIAVGFILGAILFHIFIADLFDVYQQMKVTATTVTTLNRGYDPINFIVKLLLFYRDWAFFIVFTLGVFVASVYAEKRGWNVLATIIPLVGLLLYSIYQEKITTSMIISSIWLIPLFYCIKEDIIISKEQIVEIIALALFPIVASIGTNTYIGGKISYFLLPWGILIYRLYNYSPQVRNSRIMIGAIVATAVLLIYNPIFNHKEINSHKVTSGPLTGMELTSRQEEHFRQVKEILDSYNYSQESIFFTTQLSAMTITYLDGKIVQNYFQPMDFLEDNNSSNLTKPDFIFLCEYDKQIAGEKIQTMQWGWPEEFDEYYVGSPETIVTGYPTERWLYCRKIK